MKNNPPCHREKLDPQELEEQKDHRDLEVNQELLDPQDLLVLP